MIKATLRSSIIALSIFTASQAVGGEVHYLDIDDHGKHSHQEMNVKVGDIIQIHHKDETRDHHDLYSHDPAYKFELSGWKKGDIYLLELTEPGTFDIACHSMPEMQIIVNVAK